MTIKPEYDEVMNKINEIKATTPERMRSESSDLMVENLSSPSQPRNIIMSIVNSL